MHYSVAIGSDSENYYTLTIDGDGLIWSSGPLSESYVASVTERQALDDFLTRGVPEGPFREHVERFSGYAGVVKESVKAFLDSGEFSLPEPVKEEHIWLTFAELMEKRDELYIPLLPFIHYNWLYEPGNLYPESDGNMGTTGVYFSEMESMELKGYYLGEVFVIKGFRESF